MWVAEHIWDASLQQHDDTPGMRPEGVALVRERAG